MRGSSRGASREADQAFEGALKSSSDSMALAEEIFAVTAVVEGNASLRRALADPSRPGEAKSKLARSVFGGKVGSSTLVLLMQVAGQRWADERDLADTLESLAVQSVLAHAEEERRIDRVEDELFRFERIVAGDPALRDTLSSRNSDSDGKAALVRTLLESKTAPETVRLAEQAVRVPRGRRLDRTLERFLELASQRRDELTARVTAATALTDQQSARLRTALEQHYGKPVTLQVVLDESVVGGLRVQVGDEVVDGTVQRRLDEARRHITGS